MDLMVGDNYTFIGDEAWTPSAVVSDIQNVSQQNASSLYPPNSPPLVEHKLITVICLSCAYTLVFLVAIASNTLVVLTIWRDHAKKIIVSNYVFFVCNLAVADILVSLFILPITLITNVFSEWHLGEAVCKMAAYLQPVVVGASVNTLTAVAVERFQVICRPNITLITSRTAVFVIILSWAVPAVVQIPWALYQEIVKFPIYDRNVTYTICVAMFPSKNTEKWYFFSVVFMTCYLVPFCLVVAFYSQVIVRVWQRRVIGMTGTRLERKIHKSKVRTVRMLITVTVIFATAWMPLYYVRMRLLFGSPSSAETGVYREYVVPIAQLLGSATTCVNPFVYCYFSEYFREGILSLIRCRAPNPPASDAVRRPSNLPTNNLPTNV